MHICKFSSHIRQVSNDVGQLPRTHTLVLIAYGPCVFDDSHLVNCIVLFGGATYDVAVVTGGIMALSNADFENNVTR